MIIGCESAHALAASAPFEPEPRLQRPEVSSKLEVSSGYAQAGMAELADAADSKSAGLRPLGVRPPLPAPSQTLHFSRKEFRVREKHVYWESRWATTFWDAGAEVFID